MRVSHRTRLLSGAAVLVFMTGATYACGDFLNNPAQGALDETTLANQDGVEGTLIAAYRCLDSNTQIGSQVGAASNWVWGSVTSDDASKGTEASDFPSITDIELYNWSTGAAGGIINNQWQLNYEGISRANSTIKLLEKVVEEDPGAITQADQDGIRGEAIFLRAYYHFDSYIMWENIPYYTEADTTFRKSNVGVDVLALIIADLDQAIALLPNAPRYGHAGRVTAHTARAFKGKVQMYDEDYAGVISTLSQYENPGTYDLEPNFGQVWTGYPAWSNGPETILAYQASSNDGEPNAWNANYGERLNFPHSGSPFGCCGFHQPTQNLVNYFSTDPATGLPVPFTNPGGWNTRDDNLDATASAAMSLDPRLDWTVGRDGVPYKDWGNHEAGWIRAPAYGGPYSPKKSAYEDGSGAMSNVGWVNTQSSSMNMHIYRYADLLLLLAEAYAETNQPESARAIVNRIRTRAAQGAQGPVGGDLIVPIDDPSITWAQYNIGTYPGPWDQATAIEAVRIERRLELAMEGKRFFDLKRWGTAVQVLNNYLTTELPRRPYLSGAAAFSDRHLLYPIPAGQITLSEVEGEQTLVQNPGW